MVTLPNAYYQGYGKLSDFFSKIRDANAPEQFSQQLLKDWGYSSSNDRALIPLLKAIGFLSSDGRPTARYLDYRDHSRSKQVMGEALQDAYQDIFLIKSNPTQADMAAIQGKFKSYHNASDNVSGIMAKTFLGLLALADISKKNPPQPVAAEIHDQDTHQSTFPNMTTGGVISGLHYNIQIHLPATKDVEVYNAIFKSLREHFVQ